MSTEPQPPDLASAGLSLPTQAADKALRSFYRQGFERVRRDFEATGSGLGALSDRTRLVDMLALTLWDQHFTSSPPSGYALVAVGGYGRSELFPHSDIDLLFLAEDEPSRERIKEPVSSVCQQMWDCGLRVSPATHTLAECARFQRDNLESTLSLLDCRLLAGDTDLFERLHDKKLPELIAREADGMLQGLTEMTEARHHRFGNTIFHLEPNLKDGPGGLRDCHVSQWIGMILSLTSGGQPQMVPLRGNPTHGGIPQAVDFLSSARCHLHYRNSRDHNNIDWEGQEELAVRGIGTGSGPVTPAEWMRLYFGHSKTVYRNNVQLLDQISRSRSSLYRSFQHWRSRVSNSEFSVVDGRVYFQQATDAREAAVVLRLFVFLAKHGVAISAEAERRIHDAHPRLSETMPQDERLWPHLREILSLPYAAPALRAMHSLTLLTHAVPEFEAVNLLVLRDLYHRYTVDEHTLMAIDVLHQLKNTDIEVLRPFAVLLSEIERPELLFLALLLHDTGKGLEGSDHVYSSLQFTQTAVERLGLSMDDARVVCFLVAGHLEISYTMRSRDIHDPATIAELVEKVATPERLKMLTLLTLADIKAVNPDALTTWKAENLWRLYTATANHFNCSADVTSGNGVANAVTDRILALQPTRRTELLRFLDGLPQRYVLSHPGGQVIEHFQMADRLDEEPVQLQLKPHAGQFELTVVTKDRSGLFCTLAGVLYGWGMDITRAAAFSNDNGIVVDSFYFKDRFRTIELNPSERERLQRSVTEILTGEAALERLLESRLRADQQPVKLTVETRIRHDNECSPRNSLLEIVTQDRPGLLHSISSTLTDEACCIEVALIDTEGPLAHDVFYLTCENGKLTDEQMRDLEWTLAGELSDSLPTW